MGVGKLIVCWAGCLLYVVGHAYRRQVVQLSASRLSTEGGDYKSQGYLGRIASRKLSGSTQQGYQYKNPKSQSGILFWLPTSIPSEATK